MFTGRKNGGRAQVEPVVLTAKGNNVTRRERLESERETSPRGITKQHSVPGSERLVALMLAYAFRTEAISTDNRGASSPIILCWQVRPITS